MIGVFIIVSGAGDVKSCRPLYQSPGQLFQGGHVLGGQVQLPGAEGLGTHGDAHAVAADDADADGIQQPVQTLSGTCGTTLAGGTVDGANDHRIVMAAAIAATACQSPVTILGAQAVNKSYPSFWDEYQHLGGDVHVL